MTVQHVRIAGVTYHSAAERKAIARVIADLLRGGDPDGLNLLLGVLVQHATDGRAILAAVLRLARAGRLERRVGQNGGAHAIPGGRARGARRALERVRENVSAGAR